MPLLESRIERLLTYYGSQPLLYERASHAPVIHFHTAQKPSLTAHSLSYRARMGHLGARGQGGPFRGLEWTLRRDEDEQAAATENVQETRPRAAPPDGLLQ